MVAEVPVLVQLGSRSYPIEIGVGLLGSAAALDGLPAASSAVVVTNDVVAPLYGAVFKQTLQSRYRRVIEVVLPDGESHKDLVTLNLVFDAMLAGGCDRKALLFALGGGVVGDIAGFAAACFMRGIAFVQVPTTLLAQVDSSVGGKTAVNHPLGKNMIGAFHQPSRVLADLQTLQTLPPREVSAGLAEVIKCAAIADNEFLEWIERNIAPLRACDPAVLAHAVRRCCEIKADVVARDELESDVRAILNFGHTFGHAIEAGLGYGQWLHGEAVGAGMVLAAELSCRLGLLTHGYVERLAALLQASGLPTRAPQLGVDRYIELMRHDKKAEGGALRFVVLTAPGAAAVQPVAEPVVRALLQACTGE